MQISFLRELVDGELLNKTIFKHVVAVLEKKLSLSLMVLFLSPGSLMR